MRPSLCGHRSAGARLQRLRAGSGAVARMRDGAAAKKRDCGCGPLAFLRCAQHRDRIARPTARNASLFFIAKESAMKTESSFDKSRRPCTAARSAPGRRWAVLVAACSLSLGGLAAAADSAWEANWPVPSTSTSAAAVGSAWETNWPVPSTNTSAAAVSNAWEANWPVSSTSANTSAAAASSAWEADWPVSSTTPARQRPIRRTSHAGAGQPSRLK